MDYDNYAVEFKRDAIFLLVIKQDYCTLTHGAGACTAAGTPYCYYTYPTCKDKAHYDKGIKDYRFCMARGPLVDNALPYIDRIKFVPAVIDLKNFVTVRGNLVVTLIDDSPLVLANPDKTVTNVETAGTFWKNWKARNPNYERRFCELYRGFEGLAENNWKLEYRGVLDKIENKGNGSIRIKVKDIIKKTDVDSHRTQDEDSYLTQAYSGGADIHVSDASKFDSKIYGNYTYPAHEIVKLGESRYAKYSGRDTSDPDDHLLTGAGFVYGSAGEASADEEVLQVVVYGDDDGSSPAGSALIPPDFIFLDLFYRAGIEPEHIEDIDRGITLTAGIAAGDMTVPVNAVNLPPEGIVRIDDELLSYRSISAALLIVSKRGAFGSDAAAHDNGDKVNPVSFTDELNKWIAGYTALRVIEDPLKIADLIEGLCGSSMFLVWQNEDQKIQGRPLTPPWWDDTLVEITDAENILDGSTRPDENEDELKTSTILKYKPLKNDPGKQTDDWKRSYGYMDADLESENWFGFRKVNDILAAFIAHKLEANAISARLQSIFSAKTPKLTFRTDIKDSLRLGDLFRITTDEIIKADGTPDERILMQVLSKKPIEEDDKSAYEYLARHLKMEHRFAVIAPDYPVLTDNITADQTSIQITISADTFRPEDIRSAGQFGCEDEVIDYTDWTLDDATHITFTGCTRNGDKAAHNAGAWAMILYPCASDSAREKYGFIGDADNMLVAEEGYVIY